MENRVLGVAARRSAMMAAALMVSSGPAHDPKPKRFKKTSGRQHNGGSVAPSGTSFRQLKRSLARAARNS